MGAVRVTAPSGNTWTVRRRWIPHREGKGLRERFRNHSLDLVDGLDLPFDFDIGGLLIGLLLLVAVAVLLIVGWPLLLVGFDLLWLLLVFALGLIGRVVLRRPWRVEARTGAERREWFVQGFRNAGRHRDEIARQLQHGQNPLGAATSALPH